MSFLLIISLSIIFTIIFIFLHFVTLYIFSLKKNIFILIPFIISNLLCLFFLIEVNFYNLILGSFIINFSIFIIYIEFLLLIKKGFTIAIITTFQKKKRLFYKEIIKNYASGRGAKWLLLNRLRLMDKVKIIKLSKNMHLTSLGIVLSMMLIFARKILSIKDFG